MKSAILAVAAVHMSTMVLGRVVNQGETSQKNFNSFFWIPRFKKKLPQQTHGADLPVYTRTCTSIGAMRALGSIFLRRFCRIVRSVVLHGSLRGYSPKLLKL